MHHDCTYRVCYGDTDQMGGVYYGNYYTLFERSRTEMLRSAGFPYTELEKRSWLLMVAESGCSYHHPAFYDDLLTLRSHVAEIGRVRLKIVTQVLRGDLLLAEGFVVLAFVGRDRKPAKLDPQLVDVCKNFLEEK